MPADLVKFGNGLELDRRAYELRRYGRALRLERIPMEVLLLLVERRGELVSREDIIEKVWGKNVHLDADNSINAAIRKVRQALKDDPERPIFVQTICGRGYRFIAKVAVVVEEVRNPFLEDVSPGNGSAHYTADGDYPLAFERGAGNMAISPPPRPKPTEHKQDVVPALRLRALPAARASANAARAKRKISAHIVLILAFCGVGVLIAIWFRPTIRIPQVKGVRQITHVGTVVLNQNLVATNSRIYFVDTEKGENQLQYVSLDGKTVSSVETPFRIADFLDVLPSGEELLVGEVVHELPLLDEWHRAIWGLRVPAGVPRRLVNLFADDAAWCPDGRTIAYTNEHDQTLNLVDGDGANSRRLATFPGAPFKPRWSPDGKLIRISVEDEKGSGISLWQLDASGKNLTRVLPYQGSAGSALAGRWTRDGRYFVFIGLQDGRKNIWAVREMSRKGIFFRRRAAQPVQLTHGPLDFFLPTPSADGKTIYAVGVQPHGELMRFNAKSRQFEPYLNGLSADNVAFSRDGKWMVYIAYPDGTLIRSRSNGSEALQLTFPPMRAYQTPRWSPNGSQIVFNGIANIGAIRKAYVVSANGGSPPLPLPGSDAEQVAPDWSRDGQSIVYGSPDTSGSTWELHTLNLNTGGDAIFPGTLGIGMATFSPNGRYLAGLSNSGQNLLLYDTVAGSTRKLADFADYPTWSPNGKFIYYSNISRAFLLSPEKTGIFRVTVADAHVERITPAPAFSTQGNWGVWFGMTPDGSQLMFRNLGTSDIYALDTDLP